MNEQQIALDIRNALRCAAIEGVARVDLDAERSVVIITGYMGERFRVTVEQQPTTTERN